MDERKYETSHNVTIENRERMSVFGVVDVSEFNEASIILETNMGIMAIEGEDLKIEQLSTETSEMRICGNINSISYSDDNSGAARRGFWDRVFR